MTTRSVPTPRLGLRANAGQFALLVAVNGLVGGMIGQERTVAGGRVARIRHGHGLSDAARGGRGCRGSSLAWGGGGRLTTLAGPGLRGRGGGRGRAGRPSRGAVRDRRHRRAHGRFGSGRPRPDARDTPGLSNGLHRKSRGGPRLETTDDIGRPLEAEIAKGRGGEARRVAMGAHQDDPSSRVGDPRILVP